MHAELSRLGLVEEGTIDSVQFADWVALIVVVLKSDKTNICICGDFKQTVNPVSKFDKYPIPMAEDLPFGISSVPGIFQWVTESVLQGIPGVIAYLDNILVSAAPRRSTFRGWRWCSIAWRR